MADSWAIRGGFVAKAIQKNAPRRHCEAIQRIAEAIHKKIKARNNEYF